MWRIGLLAGTGTGRKRIVPALLDSQVCRVTVVHGRDANRLAEIARLDPAIRLTTSVDEFARWADHYDVVHVGSPPYLHLDHCRVAATLAKPVVCEKPMLVDRDQLAAFVELIRGAGVPFALAHQLRHQQAALDIRRLVRDAGAEAVSGASMQWAFVMDFAAPNAGWKLDPARGGSNVLFDCGVHAVDLAVFLFGAPRRVAAVGNHRRAAQIYDSAVAVLDYGTFAVTVSASQSGSDAANDLTVTLADGAVHAPGMLRERSTDLVEVRQRGATERWTYPPVNLYRAELEDFCWSLSGEPGVGTTLDEAETASRILFAAEDAIRSGEVVALE